MLFLERPLYSTPSIADEVRSVAFDVGPDRLGGVLPTNGQSADHGTLQGQTPLHIEPLRSLGQKKNDLTCKSKVATRSMHDWVKRAAS